LTPEEFIAAISPAAKKAAISFKIPASFTVAQAALESGWGKKAPGNNLFGIKAGKLWSGPVVTFPTHEFINGEMKPKIQTFRAYSDWQGSIDDHSIFLRDNQNYAKAFNFTDGEDFARAIAAGDYATDPHYADKIIGIIDVHNLSVLDA
jgi:flagellum-specific peptidoglycan hydrolase FlgJ